MPKRVPSPKILISALNPEKNSPRPVDPELGRFDPFLGQSGLCVGDYFGHHPCTRAGQGGRPRLGDLAGQKSRQTAAGRAQIGPANATTVANLGRRISPFSSHSRPTHTSLTPFLDPLNSFPWSFFADSSPLERYDEKKFGPRLDAFSGHHRNF